MASNLGLGSNARHGQEQPTDRSVPGNICQRVARAFQIRHRLPWSAHKALWQLLDCHADHVRFQRRLGGVRPLRLP